ncbi:MAG: cobaltochelatase subunit CobN, partial [Sphingomonadales bacterium]
MHILATTSSSLDDLIEPVDLNQSPADVVVLSFSGSDLNGIAAGWSDGKASLCLTNISDLRHPMSVDLWLEKTAAHARFILVRILGGYDRWAYGADQLSRLAKRKKIPLAMLPGECSISDDRLAAASTVPDATLTDVLAFFREGGPDNMQRLARRLDALANGDTQSLPTPTPMPKRGFYKPGHGISTGEELLAGFPP